MRLYHYLETKWALEDIENRRLKLSRMDDMNDPYEWKSVHFTDPKSQWALEKTAQNAADDYGLLCFSQTWSNVLMWSHYAENHKGTCLGFDVADDKLRQVKYIDHIRQEGRLDPTEELIKFLSDAKFADWSYEKEMRLHGARADIDEKTGHYFTDFNEGLQLKEVIAGARSSLSKVAIENALRDYSEEVKIIKARRSELEFKIIIDDSGFAD